MNNENIQATLVKNLQPITHILVMEDDNSRQTIVLEEANYSLGRDPRNSIVIASKKVSRFHATLLRRTDTIQKTFSYWILDGDLQGNRSTNGIFINEKRCLVQELKHEDVIQFGFEVQASYYIVSNLSDLMLLQSGDFHNKKTKPVESPPEKDLKSKNTLIISEPNLEEEPEEKEEPKEKELESTELTKLASFPELSPNPIIEIDWGGKITYMNPAANSKFKNIMESSSNHPLLVGLIKNTKNHANTNNLFVREVKIADQVFEQYIHYLPANKLIRSYIFDFTKRKQLEAELKDSEQRYKAVISQTQEAIFLVDVESKKIVEANNAFGDLLGYSLEEMYSLNLPEIINLDSNHLQLEINNILEVKNKVIQDLSFNCKNKSLVKLQSNISVISYGDQNILCFSVRPQKRFENQETVIQKQSLHDLITGLPNRNLFIEQLTTAIANNRRKQGLLCVIFVDLDKLEDFKRTLNYGIESNLLEGFAKRLKCSIRAGDTVARWENNQFVILLPQVRNFKDIGKVATRILESLKPPFFIEKQNIYVKTNMGISLYGDDGDNVESLLNNAKKALSKSQEKGSNNYQFYNENIQKDIERLLRLEKLLIHALDREEFFLYYQPQVNFKTKQITGVETLLRWQHPELGRIAPGQFMSLAEETGLIIPIGEWVLEKTCQQYKIWQKNGLKNFPLAVNLSTQQFQQPNLVALIRNILKETRLEPKFLELEITEKTLLQNMELAEERIPELNDIGIKICLDDFGIGVSGLGYFKQFKLHSLKIDQSVIKNLHNNSQDLAIISAIINLSQSFELRVIAKGVETEKQLQLLSSIGCQEMQGNLFIEALAMEDITNFLANPVYNF